MTTQQLEALLIDQALGELSEEASVLLELYLDQHPERRTEADRVRSAVGFTESAVVSRPLDLEPGETILAFPRSASRFTPMLRAAAAVALLGFAVGAGFLAGNGTLEPQASAADVANSETATEPSPWAQYRFEEDGRLAVIVPSAPNS